MIIPTILLIIKVVANRAGEQGLQDPQRVESTRWESLEETPRLNNNDEADVEDDDNGDGDDEDDDGDDDIYIMMKCLSVCLSVTKNDHFLLGVSCNHLNHP